MDASAGDRRVFSQCPGENSLYSILQNDGGSFLWAAGADADVVFYVPCVITDEPLAVTCLKNFSVLMWWPGYQVVVQWHLGSICALFK